MIIVTGGAGFIGSHLLQGLNHEGYRDILVVDDLSDGRKFNNLLHCQFTDYLDKDDFLQRIKNNETFASTIEAVFHQGACVNTTEWNGKYMLENNYEYSKSLLHYCLKRKIPFIYASSAAIYGLSKVCREEALYENPLNVYGYSKLLFDNYVRNILPAATSQILGLRYFNVYGPNESYKGPMKSVVRHFLEELERSGTITIFSEVPGVELGQQRRDFIHVDDIVNMNLWFLKNTHFSGIFNAGTGKSITFFELARSLIKNHGTGKITYKPIPTELKDYYQIYTQADLTLLQSIGYTCDFITIEKLKLVLI